MAGLKSKKKIKKSKKSAIPEVSNVSEIDSQANLEERLEQNLSGPSIPEVSNVSPAGDVNTKDAKTSKKKKINISDNAVVGVLKENIEEEKQEFKEYKEEVKDLATTLKKEADNLIGKVKKITKKEEPKINPNIPSIKNTVNPDEDENEDDSVEVFENIKPEVKEQVVEPIPPAPKEKEKEQKKVAEEKSNEQNAILTRTKELKVPKKTQKLAINPSSPEAIYNKGKNKTSEPQIPEPIEQKEKTKVNPSSPESLFKTAGIKTNAITGATSYNPSSPEILFRKQNLEMQQALQEELKKQKNKSNYNTNDLIMKFIYSNYDIVATKRFNIYAFIFGPLYFFYRKVYFYGLILFLVETFGIYTQVLDENYLFLVIIHLLIGLISGIFFNGLYLRFVKSNVLEIEKSAESQKEAEKICKLRGGVSSSAPLIPLVIAALFFGLIMGVFNKKDGSVENGYAVNIESNIEEYISNNEKYIIKMPTSDSNIACYRENETSTWKLKEGYTITTGDCATFMNSVANTTGAIYFGHLKSATIVITPNGQVTNGTIMEIDSYTCTLLNPGQFSCQKK